MPTANVSAMKLEFGEMVAQVERFPLGGDPIVVIDDGMGEEAVLSMAEARALRDWLHQVIP